MKKQQIKITGYVTLVYGHKEEYVESIKNFYGTHYEDDVIDYDYLMKVTGLVEDKVHDKLMNQYEDLREVRISVESWEIGTTRYTVKNPYKKELKRTSIVDLKLL